MLYFLFQIISRELSTFKSHCSSSINKTDRNNESIKPLLDSDVLFTKPFAFLVSDGSENICTCVIVFVHVTKLVAYNLPYSHSAVKILNRKCFRSHKGTRAIGSH